MTDATIPSLQQDFEFFKPTNLMKNFTYRNWLARKLTVGEAVKNVPFIRARDKIRILSY